MKREKSIVIPVLVCLMLFVRTASGFAQGNSVSLVNFISGSNYENVRGSFAKSNFNYDLLERTSASRLVRDKILLIDDRHIAAKELSPFIEMSKEKNQSPLMWSTGQEELLERLA